MKARILASRLKAAVAAASRVTNTRILNDIVSTVLVRAEDDGRLSVTGTNLEQSVQVVEYAKVYEVGAVAVPATDLKGLLEKIDKEAELNLSTTKEFRLVVELGGGKLKLLGRDPEDFPKIALLEETDRKHRFKAEQLAAGLRSVQHAQASEKGVRETLVGVELKVKSGTATLTAADGFRMAKFDLPVEGPDIESIIIPREAVENLAFFVSKEDETVEVSIGENSAAFFVDNKSLVVQLIAGKYPATESFFLKKLPNKASFNVQSLKDSLRVLKAVSGKLQGLEIKFGEGKAELSVSNVEVGEGTLVVQCTGKEGNLDFFTVNIFFLENALSHVFDDEATIEFNEGMARINDGSYSTVIALMKR